MIRSSPIFTAFIVTSLMPLSAEPQRRDVWQPIHDYNTVVDPVGDGRQGMRDSQRINPFLSYTAIGTDYGFCGNGQSGIGWEPGYVCVFLPKDQTGGVWHSLAGRALDLDQTLDFLHCHPCFIKEAFQPRVIGLKLRGRGQGDVLFEIKSASQETLWSTHWKLDQRDDTDFLTDLPPLGNAKFLNWNADAGADLCVHNLSWKISMPPMDFPTETFLNSYAKLARCYSPRTGLVRDRAHIEDGAFDSIPASGMFCLATAAAVQLDIVSKEFATATLKRTHALVSSLEAASGVLPHFVRLMDGIYKIHPNTEFSTVDTAIYLQSMLLAAQILGDEATKEAILQTWRKLDFTKLRDDKQLIIHGFNDRHEPLPYGWYDWGGETALVLLMQSAMTEAPAQMDPSGVPHQGSGFIAELQSLFHPDFDRPEPDRISLQSWPLARRRELDRQRDYFQKNLDADSFARRLGLYGLSAGESRRGMGYLISGSALSHQSILHPHYILMSGQLAAGTQDVYDLLLRMETAGLFPPWGLMENIDARTGEALPMLGSLNASFESLAAYHLRARHLNQPDVIYQASKENPVMRRAMQIFWQ